MTDSFDAAPLLEELARLEPGHRAARLVELYDGLDAASLRALPPVEEGLIGAFLDHALTMMDRRQLRARLSSILTFAAGLEGRSVWGWPEYVLLLPVLSPPAREREFVARPLHLDVPSRLETVQQILTATLEREHATDAAGRLLYQDENGQPTLEKDAVQWVRSEDGQPLFLSPAELPTKAHPLYRREVPGFTHLELWEHHFRQLPHGEHRLEAWVRDPSHLAKKTVPRAPLLRERQREHDAARREDLSVLLSEVVALEAMLRPLDASSGLFDDPALDPHRKWLRTGLEGLDRTRKAVVDLLPDLEPEVGPYRGLFTPLPEPMLEVAVRHPVGDLAVRWQFAATLRQRAARSNLRWPRPALLAVLDAQQPTRRLLTDADLAALTRFVFDAEAMAERGSRALVALADPSGADEARAMADELAAQSLTHAVRGLV